ncbi:hypothetical protein [Thalassotalea eurytherma]|uniref:DUF4102 domain-containing protein n=1 Tax=Thalassotalea eurytherma TaxID=1144278 RepID=A0ABQ6H767_9GAMM|nr:hypothetical protein [Thalassotalea eurytherma]GLX82296.1 hypothetical protein theurythT_17480 [Thalassotalea eurytherma]
MKKAKPGYRYEPIANGIYLCYWDNQTTICLAQSHAKASKLKVWADKIMKVRIQETKESNARYFHVPVASDYIEPIVASMKL